MTWWHRLWLKNRLEDQLEKELHFHLDLHTSDLIAQGLSPEEARRQARIDLGGPEQVKEQCRNARGTRWLEDLAQDFRYAARRLRGSPGFTVIAVLTLALGIGGTTAIFSAVNPILFEPLPYPNANQIVRIREIDSEGSRSDVNFGIYHELVEQSRSFDAIAVMDPWLPTMTGADQPERFDGQRVSASYFHVLGVAPILGRDFQVSDDRRNGPNVVILSDGLWRRRFGSDGSIIGRQVTLNENSYTVIGVMPKTFENVLAPSAELWSPLQYDVSQRRAWGNPLSTVGRLGPGMSAGLAAQDLNVIAHRLAQEHPQGFGHNDGPPPLGFIANTLQDDVTRSVRPALLAVLGAVMLVLLMACVNVTNLLLARGAQRRGEFAMRVALGAGRTRLIRQLLTESLLLAMIGGVFGLAIAEISARALVALSPPELPRVHAIGLNAAVFAFGLGITALVGLAFGLIPALQSSRTDLHTGMQQSSRRNSSGNQLTRRALVVVEVAFALVLLVGAGLLLRSMQRLFATAPGFDDSHLLTMQVQTSSHRFSADSARHQFFARALEAVRQVPGVTAAGLTSQLPLSGEDQTYNAEFASRPTDNPNNEEQYRYAVSPGYIETMHIPLQSGRLFDEHDRAGAPLVALISESFAQRKFPGKDAIGQRMRFGPMDKDTFYTIVGVVGDVKQPSLAVSQSDAVYITTTQWHWADDVLSLVVRTRGDAGAMAPAIRNAIWSVDKDQPIVRVATMDELLATSAAERRFALILFEAFGVMALLLAATGIYGVLSGSVTERVREIGIRAALGASRANILALIVRQGMTLTGLGVVIGLIGAVIASRAVVTLLFSVSRLDPLTYIGVIALLLSVSALACWMPAWRAARVDPAITLRGE